LFNKLSKFVVEVFDVTRFHREDNQTVEPLLENTNGLLSKDRVFAVKNNEIVILTEL
jgi:hypothetical protein